MPISSSSLAGSIISLGVRIARARNDPRSRLGAKAGATGGDGNQVSWDYPFIDGLTALADDVPLGLGCRRPDKGSPGPHIIVPHSADWSDWMGFQHPSAMANGS